MGMFVLDILVKKSIDHSDLFCAFGVGFAIGCLTGLTIFVALIH